MVNIGDTVLYADPVRNIHEALVTAVWGPDYINIVFVSDDKNKTDQYGRQIARETSVSRFSPMTKGGRCFEEFHNEGDLMAAIEAFQRQLDPVPQQV